MKDVIVLLGGGINRDGSLPSEPRMRVEKAVELLNQGVAQFMIISGSHGFWARTPPRTEAEAMAQHATSLGISRDRIVLEDVSRDTASNAILTKAILEERGWKDLTVVTSKVHVPRAEYVFKKVLGPSYSVDFTDVIPRKPLFKLAGERARVAVIKRWIDHVEAGDHEAVSDLLVKKHPSYSKDKRLMEKIKSSRRRKSTSSRRMA